ncbi:ATP-binding cassette sub-family G member 4-like isoform X1 [Anastrepha obliqua]|uniref:ATP-binding cassette sub-family G member 4-like isoform X1 n=1 Tax=Anastrepha obliqua TaxID=95512 RepID=UPI0024094C5D|nr:ATP-binding cassette sub-family G member 4-like isoform X1 [Anastrepha obliqua]
MHDHIETSAAFVPKSSQEIALNAAQEEYNLVPEPVSIEFEDLSYAVVWGNIRKKRKEILHGLSGKIPSSQLVGIMGPSGAGKSRLIDVLSGFTTKGITGSILVNGTLRNSARFRSMSCYITQDDRLQELLTLEENMSIAAELKLGKSKGEKQKKDIIDEITNALGLSEQRHTKTSELSGGQRKRLSIALELLNNPTIMFLDEPTTGLDNSSCTKVLELCKHLAQRGRTIICTIHQPSARLFQLFDQVYILGSGKCVYQGCPNKLMPFLESVNLPCPLYHNPADFIIELVVGENSKENIDYLNSNIQNGKCTAWLRNCCTDSFTSADNLHKTSASDVEPPRTEIGYYYQLQVLLRRDLIKMKRNKMLTHLRIAANVFVSIILGAIFVNVGSEASRMHQNFNCLVVVMLNNVMGTALLTSVTFPLEMSVLLKEHFNRWYSLKAYYTAITLMDLPITFICCLLFSVIVYVWTCQPMELSRFSMFMAVNFLSIVVGQSCGLLLGAWFNVTNAFFLTTKLMIIALIFCGQSIVRRDMPPIFRWGTSLSYFRYSLEGLISSVYGQNRHRLSCNGAFYCHYKYPKQFMEVMDIPDRYWTDIAALFLISMIFRIAAYFVLKVKIQSTR